MATRADGDVYKKYNDEARIFILTNKNASYHNWLQALEHEGLLLASCPYKSYVACMVAVTQDGSAMQYVPMPYLASSATPSTETFYPGLTSAEWMACLFVAIVGEGESAAESTNPKIILHPKVKTILRRIMTNTENATVTSIFDSIMAFYQDAGDIRTVSQLGDIVNSDVYDDFYESVELPPDAEEYLS